MRQTPTFRVFMQVVHGQHYVWLCLQDQRLYFRLYKQQFVELLRGKHLGRDESTSFAQTALGMPLHMVWEAS